ncbi:cytochrome c biogenesis CcdA family protein [Pseudonocardia nigra]|uniref:cytochrome c biogenesis CcdA family protein n=1 Tax=Pseudonocardia nigra TaxID=1921578 RepID=UPI001C5DAEB1|nr:cytochrome c biogenesis protein CcdA [Pseudonocardia nigra]
MTGLLVLAFGAGLLAPVNPCGFGLLPAVLTATTNSHDGRGAGEGLVGRLAGGLRAGLALTAGFIATFTVIGLLLTVGVRSVITLVPWLAAALGGVLAMIGIAMLAGWHPTLRIGAGQPDTRRATSTRGLVGFGAGYAIASASCTLAVLLAVITQAAATTWIGVLAVFTAYAVGSALLLVTLALLTAATSTALVRGMRGVAPYAGRLAGALLALSGGYLLYYWLPPLLGADRPADGGVAALSAQVATWISSHQLAVALTATALALLTTVAVLLARRRPDGAADLDCCPPTPGPAGAPDRSPHASIDR